MKMLKKLRIKFNLSQKDLGKIIGVNDRQVSNYENGYRNMPVDKAKKLGEYFKFNWWLLYEE